MLYDTYDPVTMGDVIGAIVGALLLLLAPVILFVALAARSVMPVLVYVAICFIAWSDEDTKVTAIKWVAGIVILTICGFVVVAAIGSKADKRRRVERARLLAERAQWRETFGPPGMEVLLTIGEDEYQELAKDTKWNLRKTLSSEDHARLMMEWGHAPVSLIRTTCPACKRTVKVTPRRQRIASHVTNHTRCRGTGQKPPNH